MGNTSSTQSKGEKERTLLKPIDNYESFVFEANETTFRRRRKVPRQGSRKRSHTQLTRCSTGDSRQPAGCLSTAGPIGDRWPIEGVSEDRYLSQGVLKIEPSESVSHVVYWTVEARPFLEKVSENVPLPRLVASNSFRLHTIGSRLLWRLTIALKDHRDDTLSLYLENLNGSYGERFPIDSHFVLSLSQIDSSIIGQTIHHTFSSEEPIWGLQNMITFSELLSFLQSHEQRLTIAFCLTWVRDAHLFPPQFITLHSEQPELYLISNTPKVFLMEHLLTLDECQTLIDTAQPHLYRSRVSSGAETASRTSSSMFFTSHLRNLPIVKTVEEKMEAFAQRPEVTEKRIITPSESLQVVRYKEGEFYAEHYDNRAGRVYLRAGTIIVYLTDTDAGGATYFPKAGSRLPNAESMIHVSPKLRRKRDGLRIYPRRGRAVFFWSRLPNGEEDRMSLHAAEPIIMGEKWIATRWMQEVDNL